MWYFLNAVVNEASSFLLCFRMTYKYYGRILFHTVDSQSAVTLTYLTQM